MKLKKTYISICLAILISFSIPFMLNTKAEQEDISINTIEKPVVFECAEKMQDNQKILVESSSTFKINEDNITLRLFIKNVDDDLFKCYFGFSDKNNVEYRLKPDLITNLDAFDISKPNNISKGKISVNEEGVINIPYMFYGDIVFPLSLFKGGSISLLNDVKNIFFSIKASGIDSTWHKDKMSVYLFSVGEYSNKSVYNELCSFTNIEDKDISCTAYNNTEVIGELRKATKTDLFKFENYISNYNKKAEYIGDVKIVENFEINNSINIHSNVEAEIERNQRFYTSGQMPTYTFENKNNNSMLNFLLESNLYDASKNSYSGIHFNIDSADKKDWDKAKGLTLFVRNDENYTISLGTELFIYNTDTMVVEQYNLNSAINKYRTIYAYDINNNFEFSYHTQTFIRIPAKFEGWLRIPFSQFDAPQWSIGPDYNNQGVLDFEKYKPLKISLTRLFSVNQDTSIFIDNIGVYYNDFCLNTFKESSLPSIRECLQKNN